MAVPIGNTPCSSYPMPVGKKLENIFDHTGPASYTQFSTPTTGGDVLNASDIGVGGFDRVEGSWDTTGQFSCVAINQAGGYGNALPKVILYYTALVTATVGGQAQTAGTQVASATNLSTFSFRLRAVCV
jgi:hypothetical protein